MPALKGLDTTLELTRFAVALRETSGFDFVMRYYSHNSRKNLSLREARALSGAGLQIGVVWETLGTQAGFFSRRQGLADGAAAFAMARSTIGQPLDSAIYFAVDYDASQADIDGPVNDYFVGIRDAFTDAANGATPYKVGVYGSGLCCACLRDKRLATYSWLSQSTGFRGSADFRKGGYYNIIQSLPASVRLDDGVTVQFDPNETHPDRQAGLFSLAP